MLVRRRTWEDFVEIDQSFDSCVAQTKSFIKSALEQIVCVDKIGVSISGGVDSTVIAGLLRKLAPEKDIYSFSMGFTESDEMLKKGQIVADGFDTIHEEIVVEDPLSKLPKMINIHGKPKWHLYSYFLVERMARKCDLIMTGGGGDELFGGYVFRYAQLLKNQPPKTIVDRTKAYLETHARDWVEDQEKMFGSRIKFSWKHIYTLLESHFANPLPYTGQVFLADFNGKMLYDFIPIFNSWFKHFGVNYYYPLCTEQLINYATHIPYYYKYQKGVGKLILRKIMSELPIDTKRLGILKRGFGGDPSYFWNNSGKELCEAYLLGSPGICEDKWISKEWVEKSMNKLKNGNEPFSERLIYKMLGLLALEIWRRLFITKELSPNVPL